MYHGSRRTVVVNNALSTQIAWGWEMTSPQQRMGPHDTWMEHHPTWTRSHFITYNIDDIGYCGSHKNDGIISICILGVTYGVVESIRRIVAPVPIGGDLFQI